MMKKISLLIGFLICISVNANAQTHPCDLTPPTSGAAIGGQTKTISVCHPGVDTNGNPVNGYKLYDNGTPTNVTLNKGTTANAGGLFEFTGSYTVPSVAGLHTLEITFLSDTFESLKSNPFALTVSLPRTAPVAGTKNQVR